MKKEGEREPLAEGSNFDVNVAELKKMMEQRRLELIEHIKCNFGDINGLCKSLKTNVEVGLSSDDISVRRDVFGSNFVKPKKPKTFLELMWDAIQDTTLIILIAAAIVSLILAFIPKGEEHTDDGPAEWIESVAILAAVALVVIVTAFNDYSKEKQFRGLQKQIEDEQKMDLLRNGIVQKINVADIVVGDVMLIKYGDSIPADGIIFQSNDLKIDESSMTGESNIIKKSVAQDPGVMAGTNVMEGGGRAIVVAVGKNSQSGIIMELLGATENKNEVKDKKPVEKKNSTTECYNNKEGTDLAQNGGNNVNEEVLEVESESTKPSPSNKGSSKEQSVLQTKLTKLTILIGKLGMLMAVLTVLALSIRFIATEVYHRRMPSMLWLSQLVRFFIIGITVLVVAVPEGLPLAVTISLAYSVKKMMKDHNLVRHLDACETMGSATTICSDKTGTLTKNRMNVTQIYAGQHHYKDINEFSPTEQFKKILGESIAVNSSYTSQIVPGEDANNPKHQGNKTECGLLDLLNKLGMDYDAIRKGYPERDMVKVFTFNSSRKSMTTVIELPDGTLRLLCKGASETVLKKCVQILDADGNAVAVSKLETDVINRTVISPMANDALRTICIAYRDFPPSAKPNLDDEMALIQGLTCICITGIEDPVRDEVPDAIERCQKAGITVRMVTGDNLNTARSIAFKCGIIKPNEDFLVIEGKEFNKRIRNKEGLIEQDLVDKIWPRLRVLARSSPTDKHTLVKGIIDSTSEDSREVVAVTGDGTNDAPALKKADVGFAMGLAGTDVAKEASDIILTDDNFTSIVKAVMWGRNVYDSIAKFLQFQLTVNLVAIILTFTGSLIIKDSPLRAIQMLWVNLIMDTFASLALATELPTEDLLNRKPYGRTKPLISRIMARNIIGQSIYQLIVLFTFLFAGPKLFTIQYAFGEYRTPTKHFTMVFNVFVLMQIFNEINARKIHNERNVFSGIHRNLLFNAILIGTFLTQILLVEFGSSVFFTVHLTFTQWLWCIVFGFGSLLWGQVLTTIPVDSLPEFLSWGSGDISETDTKVAQPVIAEPDPLGPAADKRSKVLWLRGVTRIQQQIRVVNAFKDEGRSRQMRNHHDFIHQADTYLLERTTDVTCSPVSSPMSPHLSPIHSTVAAREPINESST